MEQQKWRGREKRGGNSWLWARQQTEAAPNSSLLSPDVPSLMMLSAPPRWLINSSFHANVTVTYPASLSLCPSPSLSSDPAEKNIQNSKLDYIFQQTQCRLGASCMHACRLKSALNFLQIHLTNLSSTPSIPSTSPHTAR